MPLPQSLKRLVQTRRFWTDFFWQTEPLEDTLIEQEAWTVELPVAAGYRLSLSFDLSFTYFSLKFFPLGHDGVEIAWDDQAHWHPHVLRWQELELICRVTAVQDAQFPHPGPLILLLHRFAPICLGDDLDVIVPMLEVAWRQVGGFSGSEIAALIERADARDAAFQWRYDEKAGGWCLEQQDESREARGLYTLRDSTNEEFPFGLWEQMLTEAQRVLVHTKGAGGSGTDAFAKTGDPAFAPEIVRSLRAEGHPFLADALGEDPPLIRVCWVVETLRGMEAGSLVKRYVRRGFIPKEKHSLNLCLPLRDEKRPLPKAAGKLIKDTLDRILRSQQMGTADFRSSLSMQAGDGSSIATEEGLSVQIKGDMERGVQVIRDVLWWVRAPDTVRLSRGWHDQIPLGLSQKAEWRGGVCLEISRLRTVHWDLPGMNGHRMSGHRFDRVALDQAARNALRIVLAHAHANGPDEDGWFVAELPDGGVIRVCFPRLNEDPDLDGGTVVLQKLSPEVSRLLYDLLSVAKLILLPVALSTSTTESETVTAAWPRIWVVESAAALHDILKSGPYEWWLNPRG